MNLGYKIKKSWFGFRHKYKLKTQSRIAFKLLLIFLVIWLLGSVLTILSQWAFTDNYSGTPFQKKYLKYFWPVIIELVSGYDIDHKALSLNLISNIVSVLMLITGVVIFAIFTGQIVSMFIHVLQRIHLMPEKPYKFLFKRPVVICGINEKLHNIIKELRRSPLTHDREIIIVDKDADKLRVGDKELYRDVWHVKGDQADRKVLANVLGEEETSAIILAAAPKECDLGRYSDSRAIETAMAIEGYRENTHTVLELMDDRNIPHLKHTKINEWIAVHEYGVKLTSQAALQQGMGSVFHYLLGIGDQNREPNRIHFSGSCLPGSFTGRTYEEVRNTLLAGRDKDITLIGFARYVSPELSSRLNLDMGNSPYIKQVNPVSRTCKCCGVTITETDELGRIRIRCVDCLTKQTGGSGNASGWYFPASTMLNREDKLIYLSAGPADFEGD